MSFKVVKPGVKVKWNKQYNDIPLLVVEPRTG